MIKAMILAAGRGARMSPLTDTMPKPLLCVHNKPLIIWHIERLAASGIKHIVINHAWYGHKIEETLGDGSQWNVQIKYSAEGVALETAAGIAKALPMLSDGEQPFLVINGDIWCDWQPSQINAINLRQKLGWLLLVDNPEHHMQGDFYFKHDDVLSSINSASDHNYDHNIKALTFAGIGLYYPDLFKDIDPTIPLALGPVLRQAMQKEQIIGSHHQGQWLDVGTPERLHWLNSLDFSKKTNKQIHTTKHNLV